MVNGGGEDKWRRNQGGAPDSPIDHDEDQDGGFGGHRNGGRVGASVSEATNAMTCNIFEEAIFWTLYATDLIVLFTSLVC